MCSYLSISWIYWLEDSVFGSDVDKKKRLSVYTIKSPQCTDMYRKIFFR